MKRKVFNLVLTLAITASVLCACKDTGAGEGVSSESVTAISIASEITEESSTVAESSAEASTESAEPVTEAEASTEVPEESINYLACYAPVLNRVHEVITYPKDDFVYEEGEVWLDEISNYGSCGANLHNYGYCLQDVSGDGIPELMLTRQDGQIVYALYTLADHEPVRVCDGYYRSRYVYLGGNTFGWFASAAGMYQFTAKYELSKDGRELIPVDYYFTTEGATREDMESFHNTVGVDDKTKSEQIENDDFYTAWDQYEADIVSLSCTPYAEKTIEVAFAEDAADKKLTGNYVADVTEYARSVVIFDANGMKDVELLGLFYQDSNGRGDMILALNPIYKMGDAKGDEAIAVTITFGEIVPNFAIRYTDVNGLTRKFALDVSGDDGSVYLWEF